MDGRMAERMNEGTLDMLRLIVIEELVEGTDRWVERACAEAVAHAAGCEPLGRDPWSEEATIEGILEDRFLTEGDGPDGRRAGPVTLREAIRGSLRQQVVGRALFNRLGTLTPEPVSAGTLAHLGFDRKAADAWMWDEANPYVPRLVDAVWRSVMPSLGAKTIADVRRLAPE